MPRIEPTVLCGTCRRICDVSQTVRETGLCDGAGAPLHTCLECFNTRPPDEVAAAQRRAVWQKRKGGGSGTPPASPPARP